MMKRFMILGGGGPFGLHLAKYLLKSPAVTRVVSVGRNVPKAEPFTLNVGQYDRRYRYERIHIGMDPPTLFHLMDEEMPEIIVNFAALAHGNSWDRAHLFYETNVVAMVRIVEALRERRYMKRWVQVGSSELYGATAVPATEDSPLVPTSPYAVSKMAADLHLMSMARVRGFPMNIIRPSNSYGPGQQLYRILPRAALAGVMGLKVPLEGGGMAEKSYIHAQDLASAIYGIAEKGEPGRVYNAGPDSPIRIRTVVEMVAEECGVRFEDVVEERPGRAGEDARYWLDSSRIREKIGWAPKISMKEGIREMVAWARTYRDELKDSPCEYVLKP